MVISDSVRAVQKGYEDCMLSFTPSSLKVRESSSVIAKAVPYTGEFRHSQYSPQLSPTELGLVSSGASFLPLCSSPRFLKYFPLAWKAATYYGMTYMMMMVAICLASVAIHQLWAWRKKVQHNDSFHFPHNPSDLIIAKAKEIYKCLVKALDLNHREVFLLPGTQASEASLSGFGGLSH
ncbi:unnamed protein product [Vicia faba]|uniref:Uncharacterized protein n=1 Tax=Vicia faba TaxID=3906 RepID=A0AAV1AD78_VICFA|nr:unnamed protein product [Vicia faba]